VDLTGWLLRVAARRPHALVVAVPGETGLRLAVEMELGRRGWPVADSPAGADLLVVAGTPGPELAAVAETVWAQLPAPRARVDVAGDSDLSRAFDAGERELADAALQRHVVATPEAALPHAAVTDHRAVHDIAAAPESGGAGHGMAMEPGMAGGHGMHSGHGGMEGMEMPGGVPMADLGEDRDGLRLDALHVALGPVLPDWPAGLVLRVVLQGDVVVDAEAEVLDGGAGPSFWAEPRRRAGAGEPVSVGDVARRAAARHLDGLARFLGVAAWTDPADRARRWRDAVLAGEPTGQVGAPVRDLITRVERSRTLRWLIRGVPAGECEVAGLLAARLAALRAALALLDDPRPATDVDLRALDDAVITPAGLAAALVGAELAAARLVVAALDPHLRTPVEEARSHGHR